MNDHATDLQENDVRVDEKCPEPVRDDNGDVQVLKKDELHELSVLGEALLA